MLNLFPFHAVEEKKGKQIRISSVLFPTDINLTFFSVSRFLLQIFVEAKCHDWWFILSLVLRDSTSLTDFIDDVIKLRDTTAESLSRMKDGIESLEAWAEQNW